MELNDIWEARILAKGADFVRFVDAAALPGEAARDYSRAVLFGKALSREYIEDLRAGRTPRHREMQNTEQKMDALAAKLALQLEEAGYRSAAKFKMGALPHKTAALRAGLGFIGRNNLLVTPEYGCAVILGKVLTDAPFAASSQAPMAPQCGDCRLCADACPVGALTGAAWRVGMAREEILDRKKCTLCLMCMVSCPYTERYAGQTPD